MTTNTTNTASQAPAVSSARDEDLRNLLHQYYDAKPPVREVILNTVFERIDAKLAQARVSGVQAANDFRELVSDSDAAEIKEWKARAFAAEAERDEAKAAAADWKHLSILASRKAREAEQRLRMQERFANRPKTPATADFDLPAPNDTIESQPQADESGLPG